MQARIQLIQRLTLVTMCVSFLCIPHKPSTIAAAKQGAFFQDRGLIVEQQAYIKASNTNAGDSFGHGIAVSGDTLAIGAFGEASANGDQQDNSASSSGAVYIFVRTHYGWEQQAYLKASNIQGTDAFGWSVDLDGNTLVVGAPNESSGATGVNGDENDNSVQYSGAAYVFVRDGITWQQQAYLKASNTDADDNFGREVAIDGDTIVVSTFNEDSATTGIDGDQTDNKAVESGAAYIFTREGETWSQQAYLKASNTDAYDRFGSSIDVSGNTVAVGSEFESSLSGEQADNSGSLVGAVYMFERDAQNQWSQTAYLKHPTPSFSDQFGAAVALVEDTLVVGMPEANSTGLAAIFTRSNGIWAHQTDLQASNADPGDRFGSSVDLTSSWLVVGATNEASSATGVNGDQSNNTAMASGAAYLFAWNGSNWMQTAYLKASNTQGADLNDPLSTPDLFGHDVGLSDSMVVVSSQYEASAATDINGDQTDNSAFLAGAAYLFAPDRNMPYILYLPSITSKLVNTPRR